MKRSVTIKGHRTSLSLEPVFWDCLKKLATARGQSIADLVAGIDARRAEAERAAIDAGQPLTAYSLSSYLRVEVLEAALGGELGGELSK